MLDLKEIEKSIDEMIANDTPEEMLTWLIEKRKQEHVGNFSLSGWLCRIYFRLNVCLAYLPLLLIDYAISKTTDKKYIDLRRLSILHCKATWYKY